MRVEGRESRVPTDEVLIRGVKRCRYSKLFNEAAAVEDEDLDTTRNRW